MNLKKYLWKIIKVEIDRPMGGKHPKWNFIYPINYGFVPNTKTSDGEEIDVYVLWINKPINKFRWECIAIINRKNDIEDKLVVAPKNQEYTNQEITKLTEFQEKFFDSEIIRKK